MADYNSSYTGAEIDAGILKLAGIETGAEVNNINDTNATDLTDSGDSTLHYHATDRDCDNHTDGSTNKVFSATEQTKLNGIATGAEVNADTSFVIACSDETTDLTIGTAKVTFRMPYAFTLSDVRCSVTTAPVGSTIIVDINETGTTILSTKLTIDASEKTSETAATPAVISDASLADDSEITIDIDQIGSGTAGAGLKVTLIGQVT